MSPAYSFGTQAVEVEVDKETGRVRVKRVVTAHDSGVIINPLATEGQLEGSVMCAMGHAFYEDFCMDRETGQPLNPTLLDYRIPTAYEVPRMESIFLDIVDPEGPFGSKECGEGTQVFTAPALANAIYNATGVRITEMPITPDKILSALEEKNSREKNP
jgi:CO/xanthine dehydrogenase Mo-binding subunit